VRSTSADGHGIRVGGGHLGVMRPGHHLLGASAGLALATIAMWPWPQAAVAATLAALTGGGPTSPDLDQYGPWRVADRVAPDELLGHGGPMQHRGITHWWAVPVIVAAFALPPTPPGLRWVVVSLLVGWTSHLVGDFLFGMANRRCGRGRGIPMAPWWGHVGLGLRCGGWLEGLTCTLVLPVLLVWQAWTVTVQVSAGR
jgi:hypothetical protein